jgi:Domain of unknown function (DUF4113)/impB/mucB/samB family C-terminal domain
LRSILSARSRSSRLSRSCKAWQVVRDDCGRSSGEPKRLLRGGGTASDILSVISGCSIRGSRDSSAWLMPEPTRPAKRSFGRPVTTLAELREAAAARAAEKLRRQHLATAHLMVFMETNRFKPEDAQHYAARPVHLPVATSDSGKLIAAALAGLAAIWRDGYRYKKAGVVLLDLHPAAAVQEGLFDKADSPRRTALMRTVDRLNTRFGRDTVTFAATGRRRPWKLRRELLSPCYTTAWAELLGV